jgi:WD40 repeat protein
MNCDMQGDDPQFLCPHVADGDTAIVVWFTGHGTDQNWTCLACAKDHPVAPEPWVSATPSWLERFRDKVYRIEVLGQPEVQRRDSTLRFTRRDLTLEGELDPFVDVRPVLGQPSSWYALSSTGRIVQFSSHDASILASTVLEDPGFAITAQTALCVSPDGNCAVVSEASGSNAALVDLQTGKTIRKLSRGDYCVEYSHFPVAFFRDEGKTNLIAGSDWNRLDIYDPTSGAVLSERIAPEYVSGQTLPPRYLDFFHGGLSISPDHRFVVDNGWCWHPMEVLRSWSLHAWRHNEWESEDGPTCVELTSRLTELNSPVCWVDNVTLAVSGWGREGAGLDQAVMLIDVRSGTRGKWFPGPSVRAPSTGLTLEPAQSLFFDRYLFAVGDKEGTTVWDIDTGECLLTAPEVKPWRYHPDSKEFLEVTPRGFRLSMLVG